MKKEQLSNNISKEKRIQTIFSVIRKIKIISLATILSWLSPVAATIKDKISADIENIIETDKHKYEQKLLQITNIEKINSEFLLEIFDSIKYRERMLDTLNIPENLRIPLEAVCINPDKDINIITKFKNIHYLPNVDFAYQLSLIHYEKLKQYWVNIPSIPIILGLLSQETGIRDVYGDDWKSRWYGQLYTPTAIYLLNWRYKEIFSQYFYIDKKNNLHFHWNTEIEQQENMIRTTYDLLILEKWYKEWEELESLARYNWSQYDLQKYATPVINKAINYSIFLTAMSKNNFGYKEWLGSIEHIIWEESEKIGKNLQIFKDIFNQRVQETRMWRNNPKQYAQNKHKSIEWDILWFKYGKFSSVSFNETVSGNPYIIPEKDKTIFSYFREKTWEAVQYHNIITDQEKEKIDIFYYELVNNKKIKHSIKTKEEMIQKYKEWFMIYASTNNKKIYINPKNNLYYYEWTEDRVTTIYTDKFEDIKNQQKD